MQSNGEVAWRKDAAERKVPAFPSAPQDAKSTPMRTRLSICRKKKRFASEAEAIAAALAATITLRHYLCDRCHLYHLTGRTRGKRRLPVSG